MSERSALTMIAWCTAILALIAVVAVAKIASEIVAPTVLAGLFALTLSPIMRSLERRGIPSSGSAAAIVCVGVAGTLLAAYTLAPSADDWRSKAPSIMRSLERQFRSIEREINDSVDKATAGRAQQLSNGESPTNAVIESGQQLIADVVLSAPQMLLGLVYVAFLCYFLMAERVAIRRAVLALAVSGSMRLQLGRALRDMRQSVSRYLLTISAINALLGLAASAAFWALGLPSAALWGVLVAILNFMPYLGPMVANLIVLAVGLTTYPTPGDAILPVLVLAFLNMIEGQLLTPLVVGRRSKLSSLAIFVALAFGAWLWGAIGALVSTPLLIVAVALVQRIAPLGTGAPRKTGGGSRPRRPPVPIAS